MTAVRNYTVVCNGCLATLENEVAYETAADARVDTRLEGWENVGAKDFCPDCVAAGKAADARREQGR